MKQLRWVSLVLASLLLVGLAACSGDDDDADTTQTAAPTADGPTDTAEASPTGPAFDDVKVLNVLGVEVPDYTNLMDFAASEILAEQGIDMEVRAGFDREVSLQQVVQGRAQMTPGNIISLVPAVNQGAPLKSMVNHSGQSFFYASRPDLASVEDLAGKTFGVHSEVSYTKSVTDALIEKYGLTDVNVIIVPGSEVRLQALINGELDATTVDLADVTRTRQTNPDAINVLSTVSEEFPGLLYTTGIFNTEWVDDNPEVAAAVIAAYVGAAEKLNSDRDYAIELAAQVIPDEDPAVQEAIVGQYLDLGLWNACDIDDEQLGRVLDFMFDYGQLDEDPTGADLTKYFDGSHLSDAGC